MIPMALFNHIALQVSDLEKSKEFYRKYIGLVPLFEHGLSGPQFEKVSGISGFDVTFAVLNDKKSDANIELVEFHNDFSDTVSTFSHIAFEVEDVDTLYSVLKKDGIRTISEPVTISHPHEKITGKRFFYFADPDGHMIEAYNKKEGLYSDNV